MITDAQWWQAIAMRLVNKNIHLAHITVLILECFEHLDLELSLVWASRWNFCKCIYLLLRYIPFGLMAIWLYYNSAPQSITPNTCAAMFNAAVVMMILICLCADLVLYLRVYALSMGSRAMKVLLAVNYLIVAGTCLTGTALNLYQLSFVAPPRIVNSFSCFDVASAAAPLWLVLAIGGLLYSAVFTTSWSLWYGIRLYLSMRPLPPGFVLIKILYIDGAFYFVSITVISTANICVALFAPSQYHYLVIPQTIAHSVLVARMILHLREVSMARCFNNASGLGRVYMRPSISGGAIGLSTFMAAAVASTSHQPDV